MSQVLNLFLLIFLSGKPPSPLLPVSDVEVVRLKTILSKKIVREMFFLQFQSKTAASNVCDMGTVWPD